ncbi:hypothetical protein PM082_011625 [Marasmius tenuissimus]|nr:hypothetical protein PM082_011625 [Marasmius tenuissimus]
MGGMFSHVHNCLHLVAITFLHWDHVLTFADEVKHIWRHPKVPSSYWFFFNRYFAFLGNISVTVLGFSSLSDSRLTRSLLHAWNGADDPSDSCRKYNTYRQLLLIFNQVLVCVLLTIRIYALYGKSKRILAYMLGSGAVMIGISCFVLFGQKSAPAPVGSGCHIGLKRSTAVRLAGAWEALFAYDTILFGLTVYKTWTARPRWTPGLRERHVTLPLVTLIFRDGAVYYAVMALANLANILTFYLAGPYLRGGLSTFASCTSVTMMSRLMLNLHRSAPGEGILSTTTMTGNMEFGSAGGTSDATSTDFELDTLFTDNFHLASTIISHPAERTVAFRT